MDPDEMTEDDWERYWFDQDNQEDPDDQDSQVLLL